MWDFLLSPRRRAKYSFRPSSASIPSPKAGPLAHPELRDISRHRPRQWTLWDGVRSRIIVISMYGERSCLRLGSAHFK